MTHEVTTHTNTHEGKHSGLDAIVGWAIVALAAAAVGYGYVHRAAFFHTAEVYFQLPKLDVLMIPVGGLLFFLFWCALDRLLFRPVMLLVEEREAATVGAQRRAKELHKDAEILEQEFAERIAAARIEMMKERILEVGKAKEKAAQIVKSCEHAAEHELAEARTAMAGDTGRLREQLFADQTTLAAAVAANILERRS